MSVKIEDKLFLDRFRVADEAHIRIVDGEVCGKQCREQPCLCFCPASVYRLEKNRILVAWEGCVECGSCRIGLPPRQHRVALSHGRLRSQPQARVSRYEGAG